MAPDLPAGPYWVGADEDLAADTVPIFKTSEDAEDYLGHSEPDEGRVPPVVQIEVQGGPSVTMPAADADAVLWARAKRFSFIRTELEPRRRIADRGHSVARP